MKNWIENASCVRRGMQDWQFRLCGPCRALHDQDYTKSVCQEILVPVYMFYHQSGILGGGLFIEYHRLPKRIQLNGSHEGKTVRGYK